MILPQRFPDDDTAKSGADVLYDMWKNANNGALPTLLKVIVLCDAKVLVHANGTVKAYINASSLMSDAPDDAVQGSWINACATMKMMKFMKLFIFEALEPDLRRISRGAGAAAQCLQ